jgi:DNA processing protein
MFASENARTIMKLLLVPGIGPAKVNSLLSTYAQSGNNSTDLAHAGNLLQSRLTPEQLSIFEKGDDIASLEQELGAQDVRLISAADSEFPGQLAGALKSKVPPLLYCRGNMDLLTRSAVGFCGSRKASDKGLETAADCADQISQKGIVVVSGYAAGVDMATHCAALAAGGTTILVLPEGIFHFHIKNEIKEYWDWQRVLVVSQFAPRLPWSVHNAMARNSIICGLTRAMILIEAGTTGGSIAAGRTCLELGNPLFAPVYAGMPETAAGNALLLEQGALPLQKSRHTHRAAMDKVLAAIDSDSGTPGSGEQLSLFA